MSRKHYSPEQIIYKLREAEVLISQGMKIPEAARRRGRFGGRPKKMDEKKIALAKTLMADKSNSLNEILNRNIL
jgi:hypothetical protein